MNSINYLKQYYDKKFLREIVLPEIILTGKNDKVPNVKFCSCNLYKDIALYLNLEVKCVPCFAKGEGYIPGEKIYTSSTNHEYNVIKLDGKWYPLDSTWGAGHSNGNKYIREFNEFYFLADPEL